MFAHFAEIGKILRESGLRTKSDEFSENFQLRRGHFNSKSFHCRLHAFWKICSDFLREKKQEKWEWGKKVPVQSKIFQCSFFPNEVSWIQYCSGARIGSHNNNPHLFFSFPLILRSPEVRRGKETEHCADFCSFVACVAFLSLTDKKLHHQTLFTHLSLKGEFSFFSI